MKSIKRITTLFASSEIYPFAKSGGLADVAYSLPRALSSLIDITVVMPLYRFIDREKFSIKPLGIEWEINLSGTLHHTELFGCRYDGIEYLFVYSALLSERDYLYGPPNQGYTDNALRFGLFSYAIADLAERYRFDLLHLNDWQTALSALLVRENPGLHTKTVYTIHNLAYQGVFDHRMLLALGLSNDYFTMDALEYYGNISLMKAGIAYADMITTVSPQYAKEILTKKYGNGLDGFLRLHRKKIVGILNGIDSKHFSPENDTALLMSYESETLRDKSINKKGYLEEAGLKGAGKPLFIFIGRLTAQKGVDILIGSLQKIATMPINISIRGEGEKEYRDRLHLLASKHTNISFSYGYDEAMSHRMYAAADFLLMPSLFEPCGLNQMIAMRYGTMPIVRETGGLKDSVYPIDDFDNERNIGYGITFTEEDSFALSGAVENAFERFSHKRSFLAVLRHNMHVDFSWKQRVKQYVDLYSAVLGEERIETKSLEKRDHE